MQNAKTVSTRVGILVRNDPITLDVYITLDFRFRFAPEVIEMRPFEYEIAQLPRVVSLPLFSASTPRDLAPRFASTQLCPP